MTVNNGVIYNKLLVIDAILDQNSQNLIPIFIDGDGLVVLS